MEDRGLALGMWQVNAKHSKLDTITQIAEVLGVKSLDIGTLNKSQLKDILLLAEQGVRYPDVEVPSSRTKKPYIELAATMFPTVDLERLTLSAIRDLIGAFKHE